MIDLNVRALTDLSLAFIDSLERRKGGILNVASVAGFLPGPGMAVYYATKAYVVSFSEALHHELKPSGVRVTALCPGPVPTEFQARAGMSRRDLSAAAHALRRAGGEGRLSRAQGGPPRGGPGLGQQGGHGADRACVPRSLLLRAGPALPGRSAEPEPRAGFMAVARAMRLEIQSSGH